MSTGDGHIVISGYHKALPSFDVRVGRIAQHTLLLPLEDVAEGNPRAHDARDSFGGTGSAGQRRHLYAVSTRPRGGCDPVSGMGAAAAYDNV